MARATHAQPLPGPTDGGRRYDEGDGEMGTTAGFAKGSATIGRAAGLVDDGVRAVPRTSRQLAFAIDQSTKNHLAPAAAGFKEALADLKTLQGGGTITLDDLSERLLAIARTMNEGSAGIRGVVSSFDEAPRLQGVVAARSQLHLLDHSTEFVQGQAFSLAVGAAELALGRTPAGIWSSVRSAVLSLNLAGSTARDTIASLTAQARSVSPLP